MDTIDYSTVQELVRLIPESKLLRAYEFLRELTESDAEATTPQREFMRLPLEERRRLMAEQAQQMVEHYESTAEDRESWQAGDFADED